MGQVIVTRDKYSGEILDASTPEAFGASALDLLTRRHRQGYWYLDPEETYSDVEGKLDEARQMRTVATQDRTIRECDRNIKRLEDELREKEQYAAWYGEMERVVTEQDDGYPEGRRLGPKYLLNNRTPIAWQLLMYRRDAEYEWVELKEMKVPS